MNDSANQERFRAIEEQLKAMAAQQAAAAQERQKAEAIDVLTKIMSAAFDKLSAYTSLIVIGGYAAFFSIWGAVEKFVSPSTRLLSFGFIGFSAFVFVLSETYRLTKYTTEMQGWLRTLQNAPAAQFRARHAELTQMQDRRNVARMRSQRIVQAVVIALAVIGAGILFYGMAEALWTGMYDGVDEPTSR
jgi:hypothetical protein